MRPPLILVAHGTRDPRGPREIERIAHAVSTRLAVPVPVAYVDVIGPSPREVMDRLAGTAVVVPAFLASGYHVRTDLPEQLGEAVDRAIVTEALGPDDALAEAMYQRLVEVGWCHGDRVLLAAAGSSDARALDDVRAATRLLSRRCEQRITTSYVTTAHPRTAELCHGRRRTFIAPYLLAPGLFHTQLAGLPVTATAAALGAHPAVLRLIERRYLAALDRQAIVA